MHRVVHARVGKKKIRLLRVTGTLIIFGAAVGVLDAIAHIFRLMKQIEHAQADPNFALNVFHLSSIDLTGDVVLGLFMGPLAMLLLWFALFTVGTMVHRSDRLISK